MENYYKERNIVSIQRFRKVLADLPSFCGQFFIGIENQTSVLTRLNYAYDLRIFFDYLITETEDFPLENQKEFTLSHLNEIKPQHIEKFMSYLTYFVFKGRQSSNSENAKSRKVSAVRTLFKYFYTKEAIKENITERVTFPKIHDKEIIRLETNEVVKLLDEVESGKNLTKKQQQLHENTRIRDQAIVTLFLGTGIRISELVGLNTSDIDFDANAFTVTRKGGNRTILYFSVEVERALKQYLEERKRKLDLLPEDALFKSLKHNRISARAVQHLVKKYCRNVTPNKKITPHKLRSTYGT
ncbi:MAG: integrase, partial [Sphingobacteriia bacterium]|nr:integrase [Sphingobacteriia bacterium]